MPVLRSVDFPRLVGAVLLSQAAGAIGGLATARSVTTWYVMLDKPPLNPPSWVFGPVWAILYTLMGISLYRVWMYARRSPPSGARASFTPFMVQLALNAAWSLLFFGLRQPMLAFIGLVALLLAIIATIRAFVRVDGIAAGLLVPYAVWVTFAGYLNAGVWWLNRP